MGANWVSGALGRSLRLNAHRSCRVEITASTLPIKDQLVAPFYIDLYRYVEAAVEQVSLWCSLNSRYLPTLPSYNLPLSAG